MAVDYFIKIEGIDGEVTNPKYNKAIAVESFSWGEQQAGGGGGGGGGKAQAQNFVFVQQTSKASAKLFLACATGEHFKKGVFACVSSFEFLKITLSDCLVRSFQIAGDGERPLEEVALAFAKLEWEYKQSAAGPPIKAGFDFAKGMKV